MSGCVLDGITENMDISKQSRMKPIDKKVDIQEGKRKMASALHDNTFATTGTTFLFLFQLGVRWLQWYWLRRLHIPGRTRDIVRRQIM